MDLQQLINEKIEDMVKSGEITERINAAVSLAVQGAIDDLFRSYGGLRGQIDKAFKEGLKLDMKDLPFESYTEQMAVAVKIKAANAFRGAALQKFHDELDQLLAPPPDTMTLYDLVRQIVSLRARGDEEEEDGDVVTRVRFQRAWGGSGDKNSTLLITQPHKEKISLYVRDGKIRINHGHYYNPTCFDGAEALIFKLYAAGTVITGLEEFDYTVESV